MRSYLQIVQKVLAEGRPKGNRTGVDTLALPGAMFEHDMADGFPLLTTKSVPLRLVASELEFFIKGLTDKQWLRSRQNHIWDEWCSPDRVPYAHDEATRERMKTERDLGPIYGYQWRNFGAPYEAHDAAPGPGGVDQLRRLVQTLERDPTDRRMIVSAWNPTQMAQMALPPCHYSFQVVVIDGRLSLIWNQRSVDVALGLPFNIASYGLLLHLLARQSGFEQGKLIGFLGDTHVYENHISGLKKQLAREPFALPAVVTEPFTGIFDWTYEDTRVTNYKHHPRIRFEIAV